MTQHTSSQSLPPPPVGYATPVYPDKDADHLRLLALFHYIGGGLVALLSSFGLFHVFLGVMMATNPKFFAGNNPNQPPPPPGMGWLFVVIGVFVVLSGWTVGGLTILSGRKISRRRGMTFSLVIAGILCLWIPFGTILGVFTFIVLMRPSVKAMYERNAAGAPG